MADAKVIPFDPFDDDGRARRWGTSPRARSARPRAGDPPGRAGTPAGEPLPPAADPAAPAGPAPAPASQARPDDSAVGDASTVPRTSTGAGAVTRTDALAGAGVRSVPSGPVPLNDVHTLDAHAGDAPADAVPAQAPDERSQAGCKPAVPHQPAADGAAETAHSDAAPGHPAMGEAGPEPGNAPTRAATDPAGPIPEPTPAGQCSPVAGAEPEDGQDTEPEDGHSRETGGTAAAGMAAQSLTGFLTTVLSTTAEHVWGAKVDRRISHGLAFLRRRVTGDYEVDEFGYDRELTEQVLMSLLRPLFRDYFRVEVRGVENIPDTGGALVVANHSGTLPLDALMTQVAIHDHHPQRRHLRLLAADLVFGLPLINELARKAGHTLACTEDAQLLLERGEVVGVMPEGFKGLGKPFAERYKLQRFGRGGFVSTALRTRVPIVPCSIVGAEEIYPMVGNARMLARLLGLPYFPLTPTFPWLGPLGAVPLPTKWTIQFGEPVPTDDYPPEAADDPMLVFNLTDQVRETIQHTLYRLLVERRSVFF